ncbi:MAG: 2-hydroxyacyl-CoA dehydratase family protein [Proteobacteria bacterium]|nr:2-hydroxyacyl-CoA dehydratase family protein [Pseudomonadota bacterium]
MKEITPFHTAINDLAGLAAGINSGKIIGYMCSYAPEELIYAAGFHPMRLFSSKSDISLAESHLQAYCCSLVRGVLEDCLAGRLDYLNGMVFPHTCDSIQRLSDIWRLNTNHGFFADVIMPAKLNTPSARAYMKDVLKKFQIDLETAIGHSISPADLEASICLFNRIRKHLARIYELKSRFPSIIGERDLFAIVKGAMVMDRKELADQLEKIVQRLEQKDPPPSSGKRIILSGSICDMPDIYSLIEAAGGMVVADDLCTGNRWFEGQMDEGIDPLEALTARYADRAICPAKHAGNTLRGENLVRLAKEHKADGVIFAFLKFCDPHAFDFPYMKEFLDKAAIKNLHLELDDQQQGQGQLSTRLETFIHMI